MGNSSSVDKSKSEQPLKGMQKLKEEQVQKEAWRVRSIGSRGRHMIEDSLHDQQERIETINSIDHTEYEYPFENLAFEGGGAKGQVYVGCLEVLEEVGIEPKRIAGASAGAIVATLVAAGYNVNEIMDIMKLDLESLMLDHSCGCFSFLPNVFRHFGWNPGTKFIAKLGELLEAKVGKPNVTFRELYLKTGKELCITAVNVNMMRVEYFHTKTTPNMPVQLAVRMSISLPGIFQAVKLKNIKGETDIYVDGGVLCNYPIHAWDGWFLSMKHEDAFINRLQPLGQIGRLLQKKERFGVRNEKTLGFLVYSSLEQDLMKAGLETRIGVEITERDRPSSSKLYRSRREKIEQQANALEEHDIYLGAVERFMKVLKRVNVDSNDTIDRAELRNALTEIMSKREERVDLEDFTFDDVDILFGEDAKIDEIFDVLDRNKDGQISFDELVYFIEMSGTDIQTKFQGYKRQDIKSFGQFFTGLTDSLLLNVQKMFMEDDDIERTVGINTDYVGTNDFKMEDADRDFCLQQGRKATVAYLKEYVYKQKLKKTKPKPSLNAVTEAEAEPETEPEAKPEAEPDADPKPAADPESAADLKPGADPKPAADSETAADPEPTADPQEVEVHAEESLDANEGDKCDEQTELLAS